MSRPHDETLWRFEDGMSAPEEAHFELTLFVSGASDLSVRAITNARALCDLHLDGRHSLRVVDMYDDPQAFISGWVVATPTLVRNLPLPVKKLVGDLSRTESVLRALGLPSVAVAREAKT
jgi:circadian clock protein KaiB